MLKLNNRNFLFKNMTGDVYNFIPNIFFKGKKKEVTLSNKHSSASRKNSTRPFISNILFLWFVRGGREVTGMSGNSSGKGGSFDSDVSHTVATTIIIIITTRKL